MFEKLLKPKNILKTVLAVGVIWVVADAIQDTQASYYVEPSEYLWEHNHVDSWDIADVGFWEWNSHARSWEWNTTIADPWEQWHHPEANLWEEWEQTHNISWDAIPAPVFVPDVGATWDYVPAPGTGILMPPWLPPAPMLHGPCPFDPDNPADPGHPDNPANDLTWWGPVGEGGMLWQVECYPMLTEPDCPFDPFDPTEALHPNNPNNDYTWWGRGLIPWPQVCLRLPGMPQASPLLPVGWPWPGNPIGLVPPGFEAPPLGVCPFDSLDPTDPNHPENPNNDYTWWGPVGEGGPLWQLSCYGPDLDPYEQPDWDELLRPPDCPFDPRDPTDPDHPDNLANNYTWWGSEGRGGPSWPVTCLPPDIPLPACPFDPDDPTDPDHPDNPANNYTWWDTWHPGCPAVAHPGTPGVQQPGVVVVETPGVSGIPEISGEEPEVQLPGAGTPVAPEVPEQLPEEPLALLRPPDLPPGLDLDQPIIDLRPDPRPPTPPLIPPEDPETPPQGEELPIPAPPPEEELPIPTPPEGDGWVLLPENPDSDLTIDNPEDHPEWIPSGGADQQVPLDQQIPYEGANQQAPPPGGWWNWRGWNRRGWNRQGLPGGWWWNNPGWNNPGWNNPGWIWPGWNWPGWNNPGWNNPGWNNPEAQSDEPVEQQSAQNIFGRNRFRN